MNVEFLVVLFLGLKKLEHFSAESHVVVSVDVHFQVNQFQKFRVTEYQMTVNDDYVTLSYQSSFLKSLLGFFIVYRY